MKVTIKLTDENWREFRAECLRRQITASESIDQYILRQRQEWKKEEKQKGKS